MATNYKLTYKNHCTPQEYLTENLRWYLDSDIGAKLTGTAVMEFGTTAVNYSTATITAEVDVVTLGSHDFLYIKNTGAAGAGGINMSFADE